MIKKIYILNNRGVYFVKIFQAIGSKFKREVTLGDVVYITVRGVNTNAHFLINCNFQVKFYKDYVWNLCSVIIDNIKEKYNFYIRFFKNRKFFYFLKNNVIT